MLRRVGEISMSGLGVAALLAVSCTAYAADLDQLDNLLRDMGVDAAAQKEHAPPAGPPSPEVPAVDEAPEQETPPPTLESLALEIQMLRAELDRVQTTLDMVVETMVMDLADQNRRLRQENESFKDGAFPEGQPLGDPSALGNGAALALPEVPVDPADLRYAVVKEWGRSAENAARLGKGASSLKGMICAVPPGQTPRELLALGQWLRAEYDSFDNINIDIFDNAEAAKVYAERNEVQGNHRVLIVTKFAAAHRDALTLFQNGNPTEVPYTPPPPARN